MRMRYPACVSQLSFHRISCHILPPVARITLNHPPVNVIDIPMMEEIALALAEVESRSEIAIVVLSGGDQMFSAGVDVAAHTPERIEEMLTKFHAIFRAMVTSRKILLAAVRGHCLGGGAELAMMCDLVVTAESASWGFPEIRLGCFPPVAATALAAIVGQKKASELVLTGRGFDGREALAMGLANIAVREEAVDGKVGELLGELGGLSPAALALTKKAIYAWDSMHFDKGLGRAEKIYLAELMKTEDAREGVQAFLEKREPRWKGR
jgi:cyclohexa-1,5-dienecarbonyl-CoA hydratase